jgi:hypothetical protein
MVIEMKSKYDRMEWTFIKNEQNMEKQVKKAQKKTKKFKEKLK